MNLIQHRHPTIRFLRPLEIEAGAQVSYFFNGGIAGNGDGTPGWNEPVDYDTPIGGPVPINDRAVELAEGASNYPEMGFGSGAFGDGPFGIGASYMDFTVPITLRDGDYTFGVRIEDALGHRAITGSEISARVVAPARAPSDFVVESYDAGADLLHVTFRASPEFP
jgi:hypothetical protein